ncbi:MAG: RluA family pseudouridine synthase [Saprospiraceae bacterium]|jgi:23S rRNA pseudouridine1911/1915/1917 synthase|nr:RluA family pseudouridine synthase [Saprospiraceae bacterium]
MNIQVLFEDNHLIGVNKPAGWLVQGDETGDKPLSEFTKEYIKVRYKKPGDVFLGVIHRLDRPVSGATVFARTSKGLTRMNELFRKREVKKTYWAIVNERPEPLSGRLTHYLLKDRDRNVVTAFAKQKYKAAKKAVLNYEFIGEIGMNKLIQIELETGRPHQIRVQLSKIGIPIKGDIKYGYRNRNQDGSIHLHCRSMSFIHPVKKEEVIITADPPNEAIWHLFSQYWM